MCQSANTVVFAASCSCGAVTVTFDNDATNSMPEATFRELLPETTINHNTFCCDYCVNKWGIDLCGCGSGEKVGECKNAYDECESHIPAQYLHVKKPSVLWAR